MELGKFEPGKAMRVLRSEIDTLFDRFIERPLGTITGHVVPALDISETDTELILTVDLPGIDKQDLDVSVSGQMLTIKGQKKREREEAGKTYHLVERCYGSFSRSLQLPAKVNADQVRASYKKGVLTICLPKTEVAHAKRVEVNVEE